MRKVGESPHNSSYWLWALALSMLSLATTCQQVYRMGVDNLAIKRIMGIIVMFTFCILYPQFSSRLFSLLSIFTLSFWNWPVHHTPLHYQDLPQKDTTLFCPECSHPSLGSSESKVGWTVLSVEPRDGVSTRPSPNIRTPTHAWAGLE